MWLLSGTQGWAGPFPNNPRHSLPSKPTSPPGFAEQARPRGETLLVPGWPLRSLVGVVDVLLGQAGIRVLLQVVPDPVARMHVLGRAQRAQVQATAAPVGARDKHLISGKAAQAGQKAELWQSPPGLLRSVSPTIILTTPALTDTAPACSSTHLFSPRLGPDGSWR